MQETLLLVWLALTVQEPLENRKSGKIYLGYFTRI